MLWKLWKFKIKNSGHLVFLTLYNIWLFCLSLKSSNFHKNYIIKELFHRVEEARDGSDETPACHGVELVGRSVCPRFQRQASQCAPRHVRRHARLRQQRKRLDFGNELYIYIYIYIYTSIYCIYNILYIYTVQYSNWLVGIRVD